MRDTGLCLGIGRIEGRGCVWGVCAVKSFGFGDCFGGGRRGCLREEDIDFGGGGFADGGSDGGVGFVAGGGGCAVGGEDLGEGAGFRREQRREAGCHFVEEDDVHLCAIIFVKSDG